MYGIHKDPNSDEWYFPNNQFILSETDEDGLIIYANDVFCEMAGYTMAELLGQPHNIIRHPDMPRAAFADLWDKVPRLGFWSGYVKNLRKDGGFYWVFAMVLKKVDEKTGKSTYLSVREAPSRAKVEELIPVYREMKAAE